MTAQALAATHAAAFSTTRAWSADEFTALLATSGVILSGDAKSFVLGRIILDEAEVLTAATAPALQRQGFASAALAAFTKQAKAAGVTVIFLEVADDNEAAKALYANHNFTVSGRRPKYYTTTNGTQVDAVIMRKLLK